MRPIITRGFFTRGSWRKVSDKPIAGLLTDLKARGLLERTLVVWGGEFGRTPFNEKGKGRDHNPWGFTLWMAGGVKGGQAVGWHCHVNRVGPQRPAWIPFQAAALALSHTLNASFRNRLNVSLLRKCRWT